jgi:hypothetical protein
MNTSSLAWCTLDLEFASKVYDTLLHRVQPQVTREGSRCIKSSAIITYLQDECLARLVQSQINLTRTSMFDRVMQSLLRHAVQVLLDLEREIRLCAQIRVHCYILSRQTEPLPVW